MRTSTLPTFPGPVAKPAATAPRSCRPAGFPPARTRTARSNSPADSAPPHTAPDDRTWIARIQAGDEDAARALVQRLYPTILKLVRCHLPRRSSEEDLVQTVFAKTFQHLHQFSADAAPLEHWVSRITINTCLTQLKYETRRPELRWADLTEEEEVLVQRLASTDASLTSEYGCTARELLQKLLACLHPDERLVVTLLHLEERSTAEISRIAGWSVSWVKVKAFRARHKMRRAWKSLAA